MNACNLHLYLVLDAAACGERLLAVAEAALQGGAFFAPNRRYAADKSWGGPTREFKEMVRAFHDAGMEVYLDVIDFFYF